MKIFRYITVLAGLALCACTKPDAPSGDGTETPEVDFKFAVTAEDMTGDDEGLSFGWENTDRLSGFTFSSKIGDYVMASKITEDGKSACFQGKFPEKDGKIYFFYPAVGEGTGDNVHLDLSVQTGKEDKSKIFMTSGPVQYKAGEELDVTMKPVPFLVRATVNFPSGVSGKVSDIRISGGDLYPEVDYSIHYGAFTTMTEGVITISDEYEVGADGKLNLYLYAFPQKYSLGLRIRAVVGGQMYEGILLSSDEYFKAGQVYHRTVNVEKPEEPKFQVRDRKFYIDGKEVFLDGVCYNGDNIRANANYDDHLQAHGFNAVRSYAISDMAANAGGATATGIARINSLAEKGIYTSFGIDFPKIPKTDYSASMKAECKKLFDGIKSNLPVYMKGTENIMIWNLGNETEHPWSNDYKQRLVDFLKTVNEMSLWIKDNDPYKRPTSITLAGYNVFVTNQVLEYAPDIDIICFNSYEGQVESLHTELMKNQKWLEAGKPYMITEYGPLGTWEANVPQTANGQHLKSLTENLKPEQQIKYVGLIEESSGEKSNDYKTIYADHIKSHKGDGCIGSFVFLLGYQTHGDVPTWYAMIDEFEKYMVSTIDGLCEAMGSDFIPGPHVASSADLTIDGQAAQAGKDISVSQGADITVALKATSPAGTALTYDYYIIEDKYNSGGMVKMLEDGSKSAKLNNAGASATIKAPATPGNYRLNAYARDDMNRKAGFASIPFVVK